MEDITYFLKLESFKDTLRYYEHHKRYHESVAEHTCLLTLLAIDINKHLDLKLDIQRALELVAIHDLCEIGLSSDYDAVSCSLDPELKVKKHKYEKEAIDNLAGTYARPYIKELYLEYEKQATREARFVKCLDKFESVLHVFRNGPKDKANIAFSISNFAKTVKNFPEFSVYLEQLKAVVMQSEAMNKGKKR